MKIVTNIEEMATVIKEVIDNGEPRYYWKEIFNYLDINPALFFKALEIRYVGKKRLEKLFVAMTYEIKGKPENSIEMFLQKQLYRVLNERVSLYTVGYEAMEIEMFMKKLNQNGIKTLVDVREKPISRKSGFAKSSLSSRLEKDGISYIHIRELGSPGEVRKGLHDNNNWVEFTEKYMQHLAGQKDILVELSTKIKKGLYCLMCFERDYNKCHRSLLAKELQKLSNIEVIHL